MLRILDRAVETAIGAIAVALIATAFAQVVARYVFAHSFAWVLEIDILLLVWMTLLSGYLGVRRRAHMAADFLVERLAARARRRFALAVQGLCAFLVVVVGWASLEIVESMQGMYFVSVPVEQTVLYASLPVGMALMLLALAVEIVRLLRTRVP